MAGIYIHIPFCKQACHYCNFHFSTSLQFKTKLIDSIVKEINIRKDFFKLYANQSHQIETIYFGGGTPSLLTAPELEIIINSIDQHFSLSDGVEITVEANPDDLTKSYLKQLKAIGVNRLSIGTQSFSDPLLQYMNRAHNSIEALSAIEDSLAAGFESLNVDMIYNIPGLTTNHWVDELHQLSKLKVNHISCYALTVEPNTALDHFIKKKKLSPPNESLMAEQFLTASEFLEERGFIHYEISNYALKNQYSKHNTAYWNKKAYLGIGPSAHSYINNTRSWNIANNAQYIKAVNSNAPFTEHETLSLKDQYNEYLMTGFRTTWGINLSSIKSLFGNEFAANIRMNLSKSNSKYFDFADEQVVKLTKEGWLWSDSLIGQLFFEN